MPLAKPIPTARNAANARDRVIKLNSDVFHSTAIVCEFLYYAFNTILGLRSVYDQEDFKWQRRYDIYLPMLIDLHLKSYLQNITTQLKRKFSFLTSSLSLLITNYNQNQRLYIDSTD